MAVEHESAQPRRTPAGRHRGAATPGGVVGQVRALAAAPRVTAASRHRAAARQILPKAGGALATALATLEEVEQLSWVPVRLGSAGAAPPPVLPDVQFDIGDFVAPAQTIDGFEVQFHPVHTVLITARLLRCPTVDDQRALGEALAAIEAAYPFRPEGVFTHVAYGLPYFRRLPGGLSGPLVFRHMPRLRADTGRFVLEEAQPTAQNPADQNPAAQPGNGHDDLLFTFRSDTPGNIRDVVNWLRGSNLLAGRQIRSPRLSSLLSFTSSRVMSAQVGLPRKVATAHGLGYAGLMDIRSPTWTPLTEETGEEMAPALVTFCGDGEAAARLTTAELGDYFDHGAIQHLAHAVVDLQRYYDPGRSRVIGAGTGPAGHITAGPAGHISLQPAVRAGEEPGGHTQYRTNERIGERLARLVLAGMSAHRSSSQALVPHVPVEGPGFDALDAPDGRGAPKLHSASFFPTSQLATPLGHSGDSDGDNGGDNGGGAPSAAGRVGPESSAERLRLYSTVTGRQNFLVPPRRHRAFPLAELT